MKIVGPFQFGGPGHYARSPFFGVARGDDVPDGPWAEAWVGPLVLRVWREASWYRVRRRYSFELRWDRRADWKTKRFWKIEATWLGKPDPERAAEAEARSRRFGANG